MIIKTPSGGSSEFVYRVENSHELYASFDRIMAGVDRISCRAPEFALIEEFLDGPEYVVNLFGDGCDIHVTDIWLYEKISNAFASNLYYTMQLQPLYAPELQALRDYAIALSRAVGVVRGPLHAEIKIDRRGPVMIEIAARFGGPPFPRFTKEFCNFDPYPASLEVFSSGTTQTGTPFFLHYVSSKGGVLSFTRALAREVGGPPPGWSTASAARTRRLRIARRSRGTGFPGEEFRPARRGSGPPRRCPAAR